MFFYENPNDYNIATSPDNIDDTLNFFKEFKEKELEFEEDEDKNLPFRPKILLMGLPRSGKSSIQNVVFHKMTPNETFFLESTTHFVKNEFKNTPLLKFQLWDYPGLNVKNLLDYHKDLEILYRNCDAIIFVVDSQDENSNPLPLFVETIEKSRIINPSLKYQLFIHKVDGLTDEQKIDIQRSVYQVLREEMDENLKETYVKFFLTSIYDYSIFEALSKVVQQLIPQLPSLENLLNIFISGSGIEKAFLCDVVSKIYIATDSNPVDMQTYELCCDMIDVVLDLSCLYGLPEDQSFCPFDSQSQSIIRLNTSAIIYMREINKYLALVCIIREANFKKQGLVDHNFQCLRTAVQEIFEVGRLEYRSRRASVTTSTSSHPHSPAQDNSVETKGVKAGYNVAILNNKSPSALQNKSKALENRKTFA